MIKSNLINIKTRYFDAKLNPCGASLQGLYFNSKQMLLTIDDIKSFNDADLFFGKTLAPVAGRIPSSIKINNNTISLVEDEENVSLHSGKKKSLSFRQFDSKVEENGKEINVVFRIKNTKEDVFPFDIDIKVTYSFSKEENEFTIFYDGSSNLDYLISMSNHLYFNFDTSDINDYYLTINSNNISEFNPRSKLIKGLIKCNSDFDFTSPCKLKNKLDIIDNLYGGLDHFFLFDKVDENIPQITLNNDEIKLEIFTSMEGSNIYVDSTKIKFPFTNKKLGLIRRGIALECQNQNFPYSRIIYPANKKYHQFIRYKFYNI